MELSKQLGGWLRSSHPLKSAYSSLVEWLCAEDVPGLKHITEAMDLYLCIDGRGAFLVH